MRRPYPCSTTQHLPPVTPQKSPEIVARGKCTESESEPKKAAPEFSRLVSEDVVDFSAALTV